MSEPLHPVTTREVSLSAEVKKLWGQKWNEPEVEYEFTGRTFKRRTADAGIYETSPDF